MFGVGVIFGSLFVLWFEITWRFLVDGVIKKLLGFVPSDGIGVRILGWIKD